MKVDFIEETEDFVNKLNLSDRTRVYRIRDIFQEVGFSVGPKYIKKISGKGIWELRAGRIRLFVFIKGEYGICVHAIYKKTQKLLSQDIKLAEKRSKEL